MIKKIFLVTAQLLLLLITLTHAQPVMQWQRCMGGSSDDIVVKVVSTSDGGYVLLGETSSTDGDVTGLHGTQGDAWLIKTDAVGNILWQQCYGTNFQEMVYDLIKTIDGGYAFCGYINGNLWLVETDSIGTVLLDTFYYFSTNIARTLIQTPDKGFLLVGSFADAYLIDVDVMIIKTDSLGNMEWNEFYGGSQYDYGMDALVASDGGYLIMANADSDNGDITAPLGLTDIWLFKINSSGLLEWEKSIGGSAIDEGNSMIGSGNGGIVITGKTHSNDGDVSGNHDPAGLLSDVWVAQLDSLANFTWQNCLGGSYDDIAYDSHPLQDGGLVVTGSVISDDGDVSGNHGNTDMWVVRLDPFGNLIWQKCMGGTFDEMGLSIVPGIPEGFVIAGNTSSNDFDVFGSHGNQEIWLVKLTENYNFITGKTFIDSNSNLVFDTGELPLTQHKITETGTGGFSYSDTGGQFSIVVTDTGSFSIAPDPLNYYTIAPLSHPAVFAGFYQTDSLNDFAIQPAGVFNDLCISIAPLSAFRPGFDVLYALSYANYGTTTLNPQIIFYPDSNLTFLYADVAPDITAPDSLAWNLGPLAPFQNGTILITLNLDSTVMIGTIINSGALIEPLAGDANPGCNQSYVEVTTTGSFDPNDILVNRQVIYDYETATPPALEYTIRFQNTGNDTAFSARIFNSLSEKLDAGTFQLIASSHPVTLQYNPLQRIMGFHFMNLFLPDSNVNEPSSHGFVKYRIYPNANLPVGTTINSDATIFFDFNAGITTDTVETVVINTTAVKNEPLEFPSLKIFPNPASSLLNLQSDLKAGNYTITISDITGRQVLKQLAFVTNTLNARIDTGTLNKGIYIVQVIGENATVRATFVKE